MNDDISLFRHIEDHLTYARAALERDDALRLRAQAGESRGWAVAVFDAAADAVQEQP